jgi:hypothetical protein
MDDLRPPLRPKTSAAKTTKPIKAIIHTGMSPTTDLIIDMTTPTALRILSDIESPDGAAGAAVGVAVCTGGASTTGAVSDGAGVVLVGGAETGPVTSAAFGVFSADFVSTAGGVSTFAVSVTFA